MYRLYFSPRAKEEKFSGLYKLRVGDWWVIYEIKRDEMIVVVHKIGHRSKIYKL
jgi:mRNA interferase RelE/StbE